MFGRFPNNIVAYRKADGEPVKHALVPLLRYQTGSNHHFPCYDGLLRCIISINTIIEKTLSLFWHFWFVVTAFSFSAPCCRGRQKVEWKEKLSSSFCSRWHEFHLKHWRFYDNLWHNSVSILQKLMLYERHSIPIIRFVGLMYHSHLKIGIPFNISCRLPEWFVFLRPFISRLIQAQLTIEYSCWHTDEQNNMAGKVGWIDLLLFRWYEWK